MIAFALCGGRIATLRSNFSNKSRRWGEVETQRLSPVFEAHLENTQGVRHLFRALARKLSSARAGLV